VSSFKNSLSHLFNCICIMILYQKAFVIKIILIRVFTPYYASCSKTAYTTSQRLLKRSLDLFRGK